jgi:glycosyltransferase involved in cell wall biosynthesis
MIKTRVLYAIDDSVEKEKDYVIQGNDYPKTYFWWDFTEDNPKYELVFISNNKPRTGILGFIEKVFGLRNLPFQLEVLKRHNEYDVIFCSLDYFFFLVIFSRYLGILKKPIFGLTHGSLNPNISTEKWYWKLRGRIFSYFTVYGLDYLAFMGEIPLNKARETYNLTEKNSHVLRWGPDLNFYNKYTKGSSPEIELYFMSIGSSNRDYKLLIEVFGHFSYKLKIYQKLDELDLDQNSIPANVVFDNELTNVENLSRHTFLRKAYKESFAVLIALEKQYDSPTGITCIYEAMACGVPVIVTDNILYPIDVETEGVGIKVPYGDKEGWMKAIKFLFENKEVAKKMGEKGYQFIKDERNYEIYKKDLLQDFDLFVTSNKF